MSKKRDLAQPAVAWAAFSVGLTEQFQEFRGGCMAGVPAIVVGLCAQSRHLVEAFITHTGVAQSSRNAQVIAQLADPSDGLACGLQGGEAVHVVAHGTCHAGILLRYRGEVKGGHVWLAKRIGETVRQVVERADEAGHAVHVAQARLAENDPCQRRTDEHVQAGLQVGPVGHEGTNVCGD